MRSSTAPYLFFDGRCEEALEFYRKTLGAKVEMLMRFKESPGRHGSARSENKVMHSSFQHRRHHGDGIGRPLPGPAEHSRASCCRSPRGDEAEADRVFAALADGGQVQMPMGKTFFSPRFGMVADRFGVSWMVIVAPRELRHQDGPYEREGVSNVTANATQNSSSSRACSMRRASCSGRRSLIPNA